MSIDNDDDACAICGAPDPQPDPDDPDPYTIRWDGSVLVTASIAPQRREPDGHHG
jgi:hypothetical protein